MTLNLRQKDIQEETTSEILKINQVGAGYTYPVELWNFKRNHRTN